MSINSSWTKFLGPQAFEILSAIEDDDLTPARELVFSAFEQPLDRVRVVIIGQDPYPTRGYANGLAFSVDSNIKKLPASLKNIFREYSDDLNFPEPTTGDLAAWSSQGVLLLNRSLTTTVGQPGAHAKLGWREITNAIAKELGERNVIAVLWGSHAQELAPYFNERIESVHPSPLSAYRGFFGSKPFSQVNKILVGRGEQPIDWKLK